MKKAILFILLYTFSSIACSNTIWKNDYFVHTAVNARKINNGIVKACIDNNWKWYKLVEFPESFMKWNISQRLEMLETVKQMKRPPLAGPHSGIVATHGARRADSSFDLNNAVKGVSFLPKPERMKEVIQLLKDTKNEPFIKKIDIIADLYKNYENVFDLTKQVSLELYSHKKFGTQTFTNQRKDPTSVIVFLSIPTFKLKTIAYIIHPENPKLTDYEKDVAEYVNLIHSYYHGHFSKKFMAVIYNVIEVYDSSPGKKGGKGTLLVP